MFLCNDFSFALVWVRGVLLNFSFAVVIKILQYQQIFFCLPCIQETTTPTSPGMKFWFYAMLYCKVHTTTQALCAITLEQGWCPFFSLVSHNYQKKPPAHRRHKPQPGLRSVLCQQRNSSAGFWHAELLVHTRGGGQHKLSISSETFSSVGRSKGSLVQGGKNGEKGQLFSPVLGMSTC